MEAGGFGELAGLMAECVLRGATVGEKVRAMRGRFLEMRYCFREDEFAQQVQRLHDLI